MDSQWPRGYRVQDQLSTSNHLLMSSIELLHGQQEAAATQQRTGLGAFANLDSHAVRRNAHMEDLWRLQVLHSTAD